MRGGFTRNPMVQQAQMGSVAGLEAPMGGFGGGAPPTFGGQGDGLGAPRNNLGGAPMSDKPQRFAQALMQAQGRRRPMGPRPGMQGGPMGGGAPMGPVTNQTPQYNPRTDGGIVPQGYNPSGAAGGLDGLVRQMPGAGYPLAKPVFDQGGGDFKPGMFPGMGGIPGGGFQMGDAGGMGMEQPIDPGMMTRFPGGPRKPGAGQTPPIFQQPGMPVKPGSIY